MTNITEAVRSLEQGKFVLIFDSAGREKETDLVIASEFETYETIRSQRKDAGGLICTTVPSKTWEKLGIPFLSDLFQEASVAHPVLKALLPNDVKYDSKSAFSITINHRKTYTGVPGQ